MISLQALYAELDKFPRDAFAYAYEGEITGIVIVDSSEECLGHIPCSEGAEESNNAVIYSVQGLFPIE